MTSVYDVFSGPPTRSIQDMCIYSNRVKDSTLQLTNIAHGEMLDLGCGKFGDMWKIIHANVKRYVGIDIDESFVKEGLKRWDKESPKHPNLNVSLLSPLAMQDTKGIELAINALPRKPGPSVQSSNPFDLVSAFFSIHFAFQHPTEFKRLCQTIDLFCHRQTGQFLCTFMDGEDVLSWFKEQGTTRISSPRSFDLTLQTSSLSTSSIPHVFGIPLQVWLNAKTVPPHTEYLVFLPLLIQGLNDIGFELVTCRSFVDPSILKPLKNLTTYIEPNEFKFLTCHKYALFQRKKEAFTISSSIAIKRNREETDISICNQTSDEMKKKKGE
ncbi:MAG: hypothetical protein Sylvanvirus1_45 [Sylvanvirus sp.]|uniref:mRNA (guanine-N(7))-methyltransferase n=1 Tax=Sylvanvirus sp. TaxID=2487774 RepID=A0A3G5AKK8_9VIRU|nr:MAG: hypothetical protein Sylvanvirus1_45 [Sylvanvirus sp.]